jgi:hypothetical protein
MLQAFVVYRKMLPWMKALGDGEMDVIGGSGPLNESQVDDDADFDLGNDSESRDAKVDTREERKARRKAKKAQK